MNHVIASAPLGLSDVVRFASRLIEDAGPTNYPPYNLVALSDTSFRFDIAVAGFSPDDIEITTEEDYLTVKGEKKAAEGGKFVYRGLALRNFTRKFKLFEMAEVRGATFENGILSIAVDRIVPEAKQRKVIPINGAGAEPAPADQA